MNGVRKWASKNSLLTNCHSQDRIEGRVLSPRDNRLELQCSMSAHRTKVQEDDNTHCPIADRVATVVYTCPAQVKRVDRICRTPNFYRRVHLRLAVKDPDIPVERCECLFTCTRDTRINSIHDIPV